MTDDDAATGAAHLAGTSGEAEKSAWAKTLRDMETIGRELEDDGWSVVVAAADSTTPTAPESGDGDDEGGPWGFVHVVADNAADRLAAAVEGADFPRFRVFQTRIEGRQFMVTQLLDPETERAIMLAANFELRHAPALVEAAQERGFLQSHVQRLDGTPVCSFQHEDVDSFFPDPEAVMQYAQDGSCTTDANGDTDE